MHHQDEDAGRKSKHAPPALCEVLKVQNVSNPIHTPASCKKIITRFEKPLLLTKHKESCF